MAEKVLTIKYDENDLKEKYYTAIKKENVYEAQLIYNRLRPLNNSEINLRQAIIYSMLNSHCREIDYLLKVVADLGFVNYSPVSILMRLSVFFNVYEMIDSFDFYKELLLLKHPNDINLVKAKNPNQSKYTRRIHLVEEESKFIYGDAINLMSAGEPKQALDKLFTIQKNDPMYTRAQNLASVIYLSTGEVEKSKELILKLIEDKACDAEIINNVYRFSGFSKEEKEKLLDGLEDLKSESNEYEVSMLKASLLLEDNNYEQALKETQTIKNYLQYSEPLLKQKAICYLRLNNKEALYDTLKMLYTIYPTNIGARYLAIQLENGAEDINYKYLFNHFDRSMKKDLIKLLKTELSGHNDFNELSLEQVEFLFNIVKEVKDYVLMKKTTKVILKSKYSFLIQEALMSTEVSNENQQLIFQVLVEEQSKEFWSMLVFGRIETMQIDIPQFFKTAIVEDREKFDYLLTAYAQTYSLLYYVGVDIDSIAVDMNDILVNLYEAPLENKEFQILTNIHYLVYMLIQHMYPQENLFEHTFMDITDAQKQEINSLLNILNKK